MLAAWTFSWSPVFYYYTVNPLPDELALVLGIWGLAFSIRCATSAKWINGLNSIRVHLSGGFKQTPIHRFWSGLIVRLDSICGRKSDGQCYKELALAYSIAVPLIGPAAWYLAVVPSWGSNGIVTGMLENERPLVTYYLFCQGHLISALPELLLNYGSTLFFIIGVVLIVRNEVYWRDVHVQLLAR